VKMQVDHRELLGHFFKIGSLKSNSAGFVQSLEVCQ
jgi:hypothetical protein